MRIVKKDAFDRRHEKVNGEVGLCLYVGFDTRAIMTNAGVDSWSNAFDIAGFD